MGTGKTVVAAFALAAAADTGAQALLMAPTEVLARQHAASLGPLLEAAGVRVALLTGATPAAERAGIVARLAAGGNTRSSVTHALLEDDVACANLTLVVVDEQQRFGVEQRACLLAKGAAPDALYLTATPIPRSLALALFGDLTLSYIRHRPRTAAGRTTKVCPKQERGRAYDAAGGGAFARRAGVRGVPAGGQGRRRARRGRCGPARRGGGRGRGAAPSVSIEGDGDLAGGDNVAAATREAQMLASTTFADYAVELLHGKMASAEKQQVMDRFRAGETQVLVATTVIEVGVDVPNATVMIVEDADRFGLAQLHQLRGRVGRGEKPGEVFLVSASASEAALARLSAMETTDDGFELAAFDLSLRREGDILGNRQSGASVLKVVNVVRDGAIIEAAHADARAILEATPTWRRPSTDRSLARCVSRSRARARGREADMRIVAGEFKGRRLQAPKGQNTRPTTDRVRESLMSALASARGGFDGAVVLDAFAGVGGAGAGGALARRGGGALLREGRRGPARARRQRGGAGRAHARAAGAGAPAPRRRAGKSRPRGCGPPSTWCCSIRLTRFPPSARSAWWRRSPRRARLPRGPSCPTSTPRPETPRRTPPRPHADCPLRRAASTAILWWIC